MINTLRLQKSGLMHGRCFLKLVHNVLRIYAVQPKLKLGHKILNYDKKID